EKFSLAFCKEYISTAENFLSYYNWSEQKVLQAINAPTSKNYIIIGGQDNRIGEKWANALQQASGRVKVIEGANHFFDQTHEFDLLETVEKILIDE
ncbi:MAG: alpha/beta hydrolase, partial [Gammaproteobacteria bacterium]|nr:alpha/beta hydrolase [Gammaproteobacteria bacterium]